jgi:hypothetical protein
LQLRLLSTVIPLGVSSVTVAQLEPSLVTSLVTASVTRCPALAVKVHLAEAPGLDTFIVTGGPLTVTEQRVARTPPGAAEANAELGDNAIKLVTAATAASNTGVLGATRLTLQFETR